MVRINIQEYDNIFLSSLGPVSALSLKYIRKCWRLNKYLICKKIH